MHPSLFNFLENTPSIYFISLDLEGNFTYANHIFKEHFANYFSQLIEEKFTNTLQKESISIFEDARKSCITEPDKVLNIELKKITTGIKQNNVQWNFFAIKNNEGVVNEIAAIGYNVTDFSIEKQEHKTTQQKLQAVLSSSDESYYFLDKEMKLLSYNLGAVNAASLLYNVTLHEGYDFRKQLLPETVEQFTKSFNEALLGIESEFENEAIFPTGLNIWYKLIMKPVYNENNKIIGVALSYINIDKIKKSELKLNEIAWQQSHSVRKPISNILGLVNLMKQENNIAKRLELLDMLDESAKELDEIVKSITAKTM